MKLQELFRKVQWEDVRKSFLVFYYPEEEKDTLYSITDGRKMSLEEFRKRVKHTLEGYKYVFETSLNKRIRVKKDGVWKVNIKCITDDFDGTKLDKPRWDVYGTNGKTNRENKDQFATKEHVDKMKAEEKWTKDKEEYVNSLTTWALDLTSWSEWMGMEVDEESLKAMTNEQFVCHCLWEMTFFGFKESQRNSMKRTLNKRIDDIDSGKAKLIPWEEAKEMMKEKIKEKKNERTND